MRFAKMHGLGNNYIYVDLVRQREPDFDWPQVARRLSDRNFGVGSDGLILILPGERADFRMRMFNADGSEGEMCGNGIRCVAKYVFDHGLTDRTQLTVETGAGVLRLDLAVEDRSVRQVRVDMGRPRLGRGQIPMLGGDPREPVLDQPVPLDGTQVALTAVSMGNPHAVLVVADVAGYPVASVGPRLERHPLFPERANIEFIEIVDRQTIRMRVWERGSGETMACGTGACASAVAAHLLGKTDRTVTVHLLGGTLAVEWAADDHVYMTGPAEEICTGELSGEWLARLTARATA